MTPTAPAVKYAGTETDAPHNHKSYVVIDELTGLPVIVSPPGTPFLTSERVKELLENFP